MSVGSDKRSVDDSAIDKAFKERELFQDAIRCAPVPFAVFDADDRLFAWNESYELIHPEAFHDHRDRADAGELHYRDLMRYHIAPDLNESDGALELQRLVDAAKAPVDSPVVKNYPAMGQFKVFRYNLSSGARAGIAMDVSDLVEAQRNLTAARIQAEENARMLAEANAEIQAFAYTDELTGLANRRMLGEKLKRMRDGEGRSRPCVMLHIDLDRFKQVNDLMGHTAGDHVLREVAQLLLRSRRPGDLAVRLGGDEFILLMVDTADVQAGAAVAQTIIDDLSTPIFYNASPCRIGASIGVSTHQLDQVELDDMLSQSDLAMYRAKDRGRNRVEQFDASLQRELNTKCKLGDDILQAIAEQRFLLHYQPQFRCKDMTWSGIEALCRWQQPCGQLLTPGRFFDAAQSLSLIGDIDRCLFSRAAQDLEALQSAGIVPPKVSFNIGYERLIDQQLAEELASLQRPGMVIAVELLETLSLEDPDASFRKVLDNLKAMNIQIEIDDFGSERASINSLVAVSPSSMKIDQRIVLPGPGSTRMRKLIRAIVDIGKALEIPVIAEGVETDAHVEMVCELGCDYMQGFALARPLPVESLIAMFGSDHQLAA
jgi:diguanylate cyclase (GGDEF)-like protein